jgi:NAD(P)-dependent dehydrogenase (short-subunit alcohol dehydrogenase family)
MITGVSSGIGLSIAENLIKHGFSVFGSVRKKEDAAKIKNRLGENFTALLFDVTDGHAIKQAHQIVKGILGDENGLYGLVNNAGISVSGPLMHVDLDDLRHQFEVNVFGALQVTQIFLPLLGAQIPCRFKPGRIVNISSVSGRIAFPLIGSYVASKHALEAISDVLRRELMLYGIDVVVVEPGNTDTPIWDKAQQAPEWQETDYRDAVALVKNSLLDKNGLDTIPADKVAAVVHHALTTANPETRYAILKHKIMGWYLPRLIPERLLDRLIAKRLKLI